MAGDWIKMRCNLAEDPAVISIAARCGIDEDTVVGKLHRLWSWADQQTSDGHGRGVTKAWIDRYVRRDGFADAMAEVGWLTVDESGMKIPNFERHNGQTGKQRGLTTQRQQRRREKLSRDHRDGGVTEALPEKRREENINTPHTPRERGAAGAGSESGRRNRRADRAAEREAAIEAARGPLRLVPPRSEGEVNRAV